MSFEFEIPDVVQIDGVDGSPLPRPMDVGSEKARQAEVSKTEGMPITEFKGTSNPYIDYESIDGRNPPKRLVHRRRQPFEDFINLIGLRPQQ